MDNPFRGYEDHANAIICRNTVYDFGTATEVDRSPHALYTDDDVEARTTYYYWVIVESTGDIRGPVSPSASGTTVIDIETIIAAIELSNPVIDEPEPMSIDLADTPPPPGCKEMILAVALVAVDTGGGKDTSA